MSDRVRGRKYAAKLKNVWQPEDLFPLACTYADSTELERQLTVTAKALGLSGLAISKASFLENAHDAIVNRAAQGYFGRMKFVMADPARSCNPRATAGWVNTVISTGMSYWRESKPKPGSSYGKIARYAWHDYYEVLREKLKALGGVLERHGFRILIAADENWLVDRAAAVQGGLGYFGKNANVLTSQGSWIVIGSLLTDARLAPRARIDEDCGNCTACLRTCPTSAIIRPGVIDATRCIGYLLQMPGVIPREFRELIGDRLYGCDECQECCPSNRGVGLAGLFEQNRSSNEGWLRLDTLLSADRSFLASRYRHFYMPRNDYDYLKRNALIAAGNSGDLSLVDSAMQFLSHKRPMLRLHAAWALGRLGSDNARHALATRWRVESDPEVRLETSLALEACKS